MKKRALISVVLCLILLGCSIFSHSLPSNLSDKALFVLAASEGIDTSPFHPKGYLLFVDKDGVVGKFAHKGMRTSHVAWDGLGIMYMDEQNDYWIGNNGSVKANPVSRAELQDGLIPLGNQTYAGVFNGGFTQGGYSTQLFISKPDEIKSSVENGKNIINEHISAVSKCGNSMFVISQILDETLRDRILHHPSLFKIYDGKDIVFDKISTKSTFVETTTYISQDFPCKDGKILAVVSHTSPVKEKNNDKGFLSDRGINDPKIFHNPTLNDNSGIPEEIYPTLEIWDTVSGERRTIPIRLKDGSPIVPEGGLMLYSNVSRDSLRGDYLYWLHGNVLVVKTNIHTGESEIINRDLENDEGGTGWIQIQDNYMHILHNSKKTKAANHALSTIDLDTGKLIHSIELGPVDRVINPEFHIINSFAANPKFKQMIESQ